MKPKKVFKGLIETILIRAISIFMGVEGVIFVNGGNALLGIALVIGSAIFWTATTD